MAIKDTLQEVVDEIIAVATVGSTIGFLGFGVELPEWWVAGFGIVIGHYFTKVAVASKEPC